MRSTQALQAAGTCLPRLAYSQSPLPLATAVHLLTSRSCGSKKSFTRTASRWRGDHNSRARMFSTNRDKLDHEGTQDGQGKDAIVPGAFAFAFDIDGVLMHTSTPIPGAGEALRYLHDQRIPFILLTNGGGKLESERARELSQALDVPISEAQLVQSHTPWKLLVEPDRRRVKYPEGMADKTILVTGSNPGRCREIAESYGFKSVVIPADILAAQPSIWPFEPLLGPVTSRSVRPLPRPIYTPSGGLAKEECLRIHGIFIFNDPRDWAFDLQLMTDLVTSEKGILGTKMSDGMVQSINSGEGDGQPDVYFSNRDMLWSTGHHMPRFGQGAFAVAALGVWGRLSGAPRMSVHSCGKPSTAIFSLAERRLLDHQRQLKLHMSREDQAPPWLCNVYMIGDNIASDIVGANMFDATPMVVKALHGERGPRWRSILVQTGLPGNMTPWESVKVLPSARAMAGPARARYVPNATVKDVNEAVRWALQREAWPREF